MLDLATVKIEEIENSFLSTLKQIGCDLSPNAICTIESNSIYLGIAATGSYAERGFKMAFASEIQIYSYDADNMFGRKENEISYGSSGCFTPESKESYWRTIHAASVLKNWNTVCAAVNLHCKMYTIVQKAMFELK